MLGLLEGVPAWRTKSGKFGHSALEYPDRDFADWKNYVRTIVAHYKGVIDAWEVTNEPVFAGKSFDGQENPLWYTEILKQAYQAAKEVDPKVIIVGAAGGGQVEKNDKWTAATIGAGLFSYCDVFSYHGYGRTGTILLSKTDDYFAYVDWLHEEMQKRVGRILPIWDTENGYGPRSNTRKYWLPNHEGFAPLDMARTLAVAFACERFKGVEKTFYYHGWHYAAHRAGGADELPRRQWATHAADGDAAGGDPATLRLAARHGLAPGAGHDPPVRLARRGEPRRSVWMVWTERSPQPVELSVPAGAKVTADQVFGRPFAVQAARRQGHVPGRPLAGLCDRPMSWETAHRLLPTFGNVRCDDFQCLELTNQMKTRRTTMKPALPLLTALLLAPVTVKAIESTSDLGKLAPANLLPNGSFEHSGSLRRKGAGVQAEAPLESRSGGSRALGCQCHAAFLAAAVVRRPRRGICGGSSRTSMAFPCRWRCFTSRSCRRPVW